MHERMLECKREGGRSRAGQKFNPGETPFSATDEQLELLVNDPVLTVFRITEKGRVQLSKHLVSKPLDADELERADRQKLFDTIDTLRAQLGQAGHQLADSSAALAEAKAKQSEAEKRADEADKKAVALSKELDEANKAISVLTSRLEKKGK